MAHIRVTERKTGGNSYEVNWRDSNGVFQSRTYRDAGVAVAAKAAAEAGADLPKKGARPPETITMQEHLAIVSAEHERGYLEGWDAREEHRKAVNRAAHKRAQDAAQEAVRRGDRDIPSDVHGKISGRYYWGCSCESCMAVPTNNSRKVRSDLLISN